MFGANADYQQIVVPSLCTAADAVSDIFLVIIKEKVETVNDVLHLVFNPLDTSQWFSILDPERVQT